MFSKKPLASLSLDLDNKWSYMKTHADSGWESFPSYLDVLVPRVLEFLEKCGIRGKPSCYSIYCGCRP